MNKNKVVGFIDLFIGVAQFLSPFLFFFFILPEIDRLYSSLPGITEPKPNLSGSYFMTGVMALIGIFNLFLGFKNLFLAKENKKYFKYGLISAIVTFSLSGILSATLYLPVILSLYNLSSQF